MIHVNDSVTIKISKKTKSRLEKQKNRPRETYDSVLVRILEYVSQDDELGPKTIKNIKKSTADIKAGRLYTMKQITKELEP